MERLPCAKVVCLSIYLSINRSIYLSITIIYYLSMSVYLSTYLVPIQSSSAPTILSHHLRLITIGRFNMWFFRPLIPVNGGLKEEGVRNCVFAVFVALPVAKQASVFMRLWAANMRERLQREVPLAKQIHSKDYAQNTEWLEKRGRVHKCSCGLHACGLARNLRDAGIGN